MSNIIIQEVGPRDGWQNIKDFIPTETKIQMIKNILATGIQEIEFTSFSSPKWIPQLADAADVAKWVVEEGQKQYPDVVFSALVPNLKGALRAIDTGVKSINIVMSISEYNNKMNLNMSVDDSFKQVVEIVKECKDKANINLIFTCVFGSYEGEEIDYDRLDKLIDDLVALGINHIGIGDSSGLSNPVKTKAVLERICKHVPADRVWFHPHDTRGVGLANCCAAYEAGVYRFDTAMCGLGGCPFLPGASGNVSTEDVNRMFTEMGHTTGIDKERMREASIAMHASVPAKKFNSKMMEVWELQAEKAKENK